VTVVQLQEAICSVTSVFTLYRLIMCVPKMISYHFRNTHIGNCVGSVFTP
jgi:hypothetical protein